MNFTKWNEVFEEIGLMDSIKDAIGDAFNCTTEETAKLNPVEIAYLGDALTAEWFQGAPSRYNFTA